MCCIYIAITKLGLWESLTLNLKHIVQLGLKRFWILDQNFHQPNFPECAVVLPHASGRLVRLSETILLRFENIYC